MELREPPRSPARNRPDRLLRWLALCQLAAILALAGWLITRPRGPSQAEGLAEHRRQVAGKLKAAGADEEAAALYAAYLADASLPAETRARIAYSIGLTHLDGGRYEAALRWFYEAEGWDRGELAGELGPKIVHALERLGRHHAAQAVLERQTAPEEEVRRAASDPVVARIGRREFHRSDLDAALDDLPPEVASAFDGAQGRGEFLRRFVADELLWIRAQKLEFDDDPEVRRRHAALLKQLAVAKFVEEEVLRGIEVDEADLENFFAANRSRYELPGEGEEEARVPELEEVRPAVERDYRLTKIQAAYQELIDSELEAADVEIFPERLTGGG